MVNFKSTMPRAGFFAAMTLALSFTTAAQDPKSYTDNAVKAIGALDDSWYNTKTGIWDNAWWNSANVMATLADFTILRTTEASNLNVAGIISNTFAQAQKTNMRAVKTRSATGMVSSEYCLNLDDNCIARRGLLDKRGFADFINRFYDDEGWWALGLIRSYDATQQKEYLNAAVKIFKDMQTGLGGPCGGGIFWSKDRKYVNAIANELYLSVAASLANRIPEDPTYLAAAKEQWTWFETRSSLINEQNLINDGLDGNCHNNGMQTWSYNQGVILGGLVELSIATGETTLTDRATSIARAAIATLATPEGVLAETDRCELRAGNCGRDGQQFKGVFVRNLRYLHEVAPQEDFRQFIMRNADSIWEHARNERNMLGVSWTGPYVDATGASQSSALDVLVAAIAVA